MFARLVKPTGFGVNRRIAQQVRFIATAESSAGRVMPASRARATPISHDRATLTLRVR
jgi:carbamoyl-phosphate synthase small subunit